MTAPAFSIEQGSFLWSLHSSRMFDILRTMSKSKCAVCDYPNVEKGELFCPVCKPHLARLVQASTPLGDSSIELRNVRLNTDIQGTGYVVAIEGGGTDGWQHPFGINGSTKCLICQSLTDNRPVCEPCEMAVSELSSKVEILMRIIDVMDDVEWMVTFMNLMGRDVARKWMAKELDVNLDEEFDEGPSR